MELTEKVEALTKKIEGLEEDRVAFIARFNKESTTINALLEDAREELEELSKEMDVIITKYFNDNPNVEQKLLDAYKERK